GKPSLRIVGPTGTESLIKNLLEVHEYLQDRLELQFQELDAGNYHIGPFEIASKETRHSMHCLAYKIDNKFTFSADTEAFKELIEFATDSQILVHDCSFPDEIDVSNHPTP
ncbi:MAG: MBL fold metallo-hydrolase, partial [Halobacteriaceae archaeon]